jgi:hypothetical protein
MATKLGAATSVLLTLTVWAVDVRAAFVVTNADQWDGQTTLTGPSKVWGETFTAPSGQPALEGFSFWLQSYPADPNSRTPFAMQVRASVVAWDGKKATGPILGSTIVDNPEYLLPDRPQRIDFEFSSIELVGGRSYVAIIEQLLPSPGQLYLGFISSPDSLPGSYGGPYAGNFDLIRLRPWTIFPNGDLVMEFRYSVPEPSGRLLCAVGAALLFVSHIRWRRVLYVSAEAKANVK